MILQNDFQKQWNDIGAEATAVFQKVGMSGWYILGEEVKSFEKDLAKFWGLNHAVGVANGMDAIEIGLRALGIASGDKVLTTPLTAFATTLAIMRIGAVPVFVDVDSLGQIDLKLCRKALEAHRDIKAFVPVHLFGISGNHDELAKLKNEFGILILEDCAQAIGALNHGKMVGSVGQVAATSFYPTKNLGTMGDGGALLCNNVDIAEKAKKCRNYGQSVQYIHDEFGLNSRLDEVHASLLKNVFLPKLPAWTEKRRKTASQYLNSIQNPNIKLLTVGKESSPVWHLFPVLVEASKRESFRAWLQKSNIGNGIHYPRLVTDQPALREYGKSEVLSPLGNAKYFCESEVSLPIHPYLADDEIKHIIEACNQWKP